MEQDDDKSVKSSSIATQTGGELLKDYDPVSSLLGTWIIQLREKNIFSWSWEKSQAIIIISVEGQGILHSWKKSEFCLPGKSQGKLMFFQM